MSIPKKAERHWRAVERESTWRTERGSETPPLCTQSPIAFIMVVTLFHGHCFTDSKMAPAWALSPHIGVTVMLGVRCCHSRAESGPLGTAGSLVLVGSNQCCLESLSVKREQNLFLLFHLSQRAATFAVSSVPESSNISESWHIVSSAKYKGPTLAYIFLPINDVFCGWCNAVIIVSHCSLCEQ